jgi:thiol:disulfide interchange protein DsbD
MNEFKVVGGIVEIAAALKFLNIADHHWQWGLFGRDMVLALWAASALAIALYVLGRLRFSGDSEVKEVGAGRLLTGVIFAAIAIWIASGLFGNDLVLLESFLAPEA